MIPGRLTRSRKCAHMQWRREPSCHRTPRYRCRNKNQDVLRASLRQSQKPIYRWRREERSSACSEDRVRKKRRAELCLLPFRGQLFLMRPQLVERWWAAGHSERGQQGGDICERHGRIQCADKPKGGTCLCRNQLVLSVPLQTPICSMLGPSHTRLLVASR